MYTEKFSQFLKSRNQRGLDFQVAKRNLFDFGDLLESHDVPYFLIFGTLLGAVRERNFIAHDTDVDIAALIEHHDTVRQICDSAQLAELGFQFGRDSHGMISIWRDGEYIDLYFFEEKQVEYWCDFMRIQKEQLKDGFSQIEFLGRIFNTVKNPEEDLRWRFGEDWRVPKPNCPSEW